MFNKNIYVQRAYQDYLTELSNNNYNLKSLTLSEIQIKFLYDPKYCLSQFDIYLYIKALDYLRYNNN